MTATMPDRSTLGAYIFISKMDFLIALLYDALSIRAKKPKECHEALLIIYRFCATMEKLFGIT